MQSTAQHQRLPAVYHTNPVIHAFRLFTCAQGCEQACAEVGAWGLQGMKQGGGGAGGIRTAPKNNGPQFWELCRLCAHGAPHQAVATATTGKGGRGLKRGQRESGEGERVGLHGV